MERRGAWLRSVLEAIHPQAPHHTLRAVRRLQHQRLCADDHAAAAAVVVVLLLALLALVAQRLLVASSAAVWEGANDVAVVAVVRTLLLGSALALRWWDDDAATANGDHLLPVAEVDTQGCQALVATTLMMCCDQLAPRMFHCFGHTGPVPRPVLDCRGGWHCAVWHCAVWATVCETRCSVLTLPQGA